MSYMYIKIVHFRNDGMIDSTQNYTTVKIPFR